MPRPRALHMPPHRATDLPPIASPGYHHAGRDLCMSCAEGAGTARDEDGAGCCVKVRRIETDERGERGERNEREFRI